MFKKITLSLIVCVALFADENVKSLDTMTVTADKREVKLFETDTSIDVINEGDIEDFGVTDSYDISLFTSNVYFTHTGPFMISDFGSIRGITSSMDGSTAFSVYVDDVYQRQISFGLLDIQRIEVLKGPQGTLYGRNSEAGVINVVTKKPNLAKLEGKIKLEVAQENTKGLSGSVNVPLTDTSALKVALSRHESDGYFTNTYDNDDSQEQKNTDARASLYLNPTDRLKAYLTYNYQDYKNDGYANFAPFSNDDMTKVNVDYMGYAKYRSHQASLNAMYDFDFAKLQSITSYNKTKNISSNDIDFTPADVMKVTIDYKSNFLSQELRLISQKNENYEYLGGVYLFSEKENIKLPMSMNNQGFQMEMTSDSHTDTDGIAFFGEGSYYLGDFKATLGMRYDREQKDFSNTYSMTGMDDTKTDNDETFDAFLPKFALAYYVNDNIKPYFSVAKGYRSGGFNTQTNIGSVYDPEYTWNYELGVKTQYSNFIFNAALFYIDWKDLQVEITTDGGASFYMENAAKAESKGVELEALWQATQNLLISANFGYTDAKYKDYSNGSAVYNDKYVIDSPKYTYNLSSRYRFDNGIYLGANMASFRDIYFDNENTQKQSYTIVNAKIGYEHDNFDIYIYGKNLFDEEYITRAFIMGEQWIGRAGQPQIFGLEFAYRF